MKTPKFEIIAGTYEEYLLGFNYMSKQTGLQQSFAIHEHTSSIRCVAVSNNYLATGSADDRIIVYDLRLRKEHCMLNYHNATVNCLQFTNNHSHLISGSSDGELAIVRVGSWQLEKTWAKAHKGSAILDIAVHYSGKLALTLGADCSLRTWNLVKGRPAYVINLNSKSKDARNLNKIVWADDGVRFILYGGKYTEIWSIETGGILKVIEHHDKICSCIWVSENQLIVGYEDGQLALVEINKLTKDLHEAHSGRVKALVKYSKWIVSASSTGEIKVWTSKLKELSTHNTACRITCLAIAETTLKIKEEKVDETVEIEEEVKKELMKKSTVVIEMEEGDNEIEINREVKSKKSKKKKTDDFVCVQDTNKNIKMKKKKKRIDDDQEVIGKPEVKKKRMKYSEESDLIETRKDSFSKKESATKKLKGKKRSQNLEQGSNEKSKKKNKIKT